MDHHPSHQDQEQELREAPLLRSLQARRQAGWEAPEEYFDRMQAQLRDRRDDEAVLDEAPHLSSAGRKLRFPAPAGYFEGLPIRLRSHLNPPRGRILSMWERLSYGALAAAAALAMVWLIRSAAPQDVATSSPYLAWESIPTEQLLAMAEAEDYDPNMIAEVMAESEPKADEDASGLEGKEEPDPLLDAVDLEDLESAWLESQNPQNRDANTHE